MTEMDENAYSSTTEDLNGWNRVILMLLELSTDLTLDYFSLICLSRRDKPVSFSLSLYS